MEKKEKSFGIKSDCVYSHRSKYSVWFLRGGILLSLLCLFLFLSYCSGCNDVQRHRVLTFFFEGVPDMDDPFKPVKIRRTRGDKVSSGGKVLSGFQARLAQQKIGMQHKPAGECHKCHVGKLGRDYKRLSKPIPELCFTCHEDHAARGGNLHGPRAYGECMFCHRPHQSGFVHLQVAAQPELCYRCHRREDMGTIVDHENKIETICTDCHDPHVSPRKKLLKPGVFVGDPNSASAEDLEYDPNSVNLSN